MRASGAGIEVLNAAVVHVVAAVLRDAHDRVLLAQRGGGDDLTGLWEFPGGKREAGETSLQALQRELWEELGISLDSAEPLIEVPHDSGSKRIALEVFSATGWRGDARGREGQSLIWLAPDRLDAQAMPSADRPVVAALRQPDCYAITPQPTADLTRFLGELQQSLDAGVRRVQLRATQLSERQTARLVPAVNAMCRQRGVDLLLNSACPNALRLSTALGCGLHLTATDLRRAANRAVPSTSLLAASCHSAAELAKASALGCEFVVLGPVAATPTHPDAVPLGWQAFRVLRETSALPIYALGGMTRSDLPVARANGAQGVAAIRGLWAAPS